MLLVHADCQVYRRLKAMRDDAMDDTLGHVQDVAFAHLDSLASLHITERRIVVVRTALGFTAPHVRKLSKVCIKKS
jgi:hypothetical protein